jgi:hypothetical protein
MKRELLVLVLETAASGQMSAHCSVSWKEHLSHLVTLRGLTRLKNLDKRMPKADIREGLEVLHFHGEAGMLLLWQ